MSTLVETTTKENRYALDVNNLFKYPSDKVIKILQACAGAVEMRSINVDKSGTSEFRFETTTNPEQFVSTAFKVHFQIPFIIKLKAWPKDENDDDIEITSENFMDLVFKHGNRLALSQLAPSQGIATQELKFNDVAINNNSSDLGDMVNIVSQYWDRAAVNKELQASIPDRYADINDYDKQDISFIDTWGQPANVGISPDFDNPFSSKVQTDYNTRTPTWRFVEEDKENLSIRAVSNFWTYLFFSVGTLIENEIGLAGIEKVGLNLRLDADLGSKLFIRKGDEIVSVKQDFSDTANTQAKMIMRVLTPPQYVLEGMRDPATQLLKPYSISTPLFQHSKFKPVPCAAKSSAEFSHYGLTTASIPRSIIIALTRDKKASPLDSGVNYGLIKDLTVRIDSAITNFQDIESLIAVAQTAGYSELDLNGMLTKGFAVRLPCDTCLNLPKNTVVGEAGTRSISVSGHFYNQSSTAQTFTLSITVVSEAELQYSNQRFAIASGVLVPAALLNSEYFLRELYAENMRSLEVLGGAAGAGIFGDAARWVKKNGLSVLKKAWDNREKIASVVGDVVSTAKALRGGKQAYNNVSGGSGITTLGAGSVSTSIFK